MVTAADAPSIYDIPKVLHREGLDAYVVRRLDLPFRDVDWTTWDDLLRRVHHPKEEVTVALVGKYIDLPDAYLSVGEALRAGGFAHEAKVNIRWVASDECETPAGRRPAPQRRRRGLRARRLRHPRHRGQARRAAPTPAPTASRPSGLCLGLQCMVIEYARNVAGLEKAASTEFDPDCPEPVIATMEEQKAFVDGAGDLGGTMRLGLYPAALHGGQRRARGVRRRRRSRSGTGTATRSTTPTATSSRQAGMVFSGTNPELRPGRVRRAAARRAPLLRRHPGPPRAALPPDPPAPAVRGPGRRGDRAAEGAAVPDRRDRRCAARIAGGRRTVSVGGHAIADLADGDELWPVESSTDLYRDDWVVALRADAIRRPDDPTARRSGALVLEHPGAVVVLALDDAEPGAVPAAVPARRAAPASSSCPPGCSTSRGSRPRRSPSASCARRPALEAGHWTHLTSTYSSPGHLRGASSTSSSPAACGTSTAATSCPQHEEADMETLLGAVRRPARPRSRTGRVADGPLVHRGADGARSGQGDARQRPER